MKTSGLRGKFSPMNTATDAQCETINQLKAEFADEMPGCLFEVRYPTYIGGNDAATRGAIVVSVNGRIACLVEKDGTTY